MKAKIRWPSEIVQRAEIALGDLFVANHTDSDLLALAVNVGHINYALVLAQFGPKVFDELPHMVSLNEMIEPDEWSRRIRDGLTIEPKERTPAGVACLNREIPAPHGSLAILPDGSRGIYLRRDGTPGLIFNIETGESVSRIGIRALEHWRLFWIDGEDSIQLCAF